MEGVQALLYPGYFSETIFNGLTYSAENTRLMVESYIRDKFTLLAVDYTGKVIGLAVLLAGRTYYEEVEADIEFLCVAEECRGTDVARMLVSSIIDVAENTFGAKVFYASCCSGISEKNDALWVNLWSKFNFKKLGTVMIRSAA